MELASKDACTGCGNCRLVCNVVFKKEKLKRPIIHAAKMCIKKVLGRR